jgi:hypothetical protein
MENYLENISCTLREVKLLLPCVPILKAVQFPDSSVILLIARNMTQCPTVGLCGLSCFYCILLCYVFCKIWWYLNFIFSFVCYEVCFHPYYCNYLNFVLQNFVIIVYVFYRNGVVHHNQCYFLEQFHIHAGTKGRWTQEICVSVCVCVYVCIHVCMYVCACVCVYTYVCMY